MILKVLKMLAQGASQHGDLPLSVFKCSFWCSKTEISNMPFLITKVLHDRTSSKNKVKVEVHSPCHASCKSWGELPKY